jgi:hypothetical protein
VTVLSGQVEGVGAQPVGSHWSSSGEKAADAGVISESGSAQELFSEVDEARRVRSGRFGEHRNGLKSVNDISKLQIGPESFLDKFSYSNIVQIYTSKIHRFKLRYISQYLGQ